MTACIDHGKQGSEDGYTKVRTGKTSQALHRMVYVKSKGLDIEDIRGLIVRHSCDNPRCINPDHLLIGTVADNNRDTAERRRVRHLKLTVEQVNEIRKNCTPSKRGGQKTHNEFSYAAYAKRFSVAVNTIRYAYTRHTFKHLP